MLTLNTDDIEYTSHDSVYLIEAIFLESKKLTLNNLDIDVTGKIFIAPQSLQFEAINVTIIDYHNNVAGFIFLID